jgi:mannosyltransferase
MPALNRRNRYQFLTILAAAAVCWLAFLVFATHLTGQSMWIDEHQTWRVSRMGPIGIIREVAIDVHPPFYYLWVWLWMTVSGSENLFVLRLSSVIPAVLAVAVCYRLAVEWFRSRWVALAAAAYLATSGFFVYYTRDLRMYPLTVFLVTLSWCFFTRLVQGKLRNVISYAIVVALMAYTYYYTAFIVFIQIVVALLFYRQRVKALFQAYCAALVLFLPWIPAFFGQLTIAKAQSGSTTNGPIIGKFLGTVPTNIDTITEFINTYTGKQPAFVMLLIALAIVVGFRTTVSRQSRRWLIAVILWVLLTSILFFGLNLIIPIYGLRYLLFIVPALALLVGISINIVPESVGRVAVIAILIIAGVFGHPQAFPAPSIPHQEMLRTIAERYRPGDRIWYNPPEGALGSNLANEVVYHLQYDAPNLNTDWFVWQAPQEYADRVIAPRVWDARPYWVSIPDAALGPLTQGRIVTEKYDFGAYSVRLYEAPPSPDSRITYGGLLNVLTDGTDRPTYKAGETMQVKIWWQAEKQPLLDYSYVLYVQPINGAPLIQLDNALVIERQATTQWQPGSSYKLLKTEIVLPETTQAGEYEIWLGVYHYANPTRLTVDGPNAATINVELSLARVGIITVK